MTEKRFNNVGSYLYDGDECIGHYHDVRFREEIVELLNAQHKEIQSLKKEIENNIDSFKRSRSRRIQVEEENEQLKQLNIPIDEIKDTVSDYKGRIIGVYYND